MGTVTWVQPESLDELRAALRDGARLHGGGTGLMRTPPSRGTIADLSRLGIDAARATEASVRCGGAASITTVARAIAGADREHIAVRALSRMAAPALRNRITLGGSIALFPPWSSVIGPLLATGTRLTLAGSCDETVGLDEYLERRELRRGTAVVEVDIPFTPGTQSWWFAFTRTRFTYPLFSVAVLGRGENGALADLRIVVTGAVGRYARLAELENRLVGDGVPQQLAAGELGVRIPDRQGFGGEYLTHVAAVQVRRGVAAVAGAGPGDAA